MATLRPDCTTAAPGSVALNDKHVLQRMWHAVSKRRTLAIGRLHDDEGRSCAMGCFWEDNSGVVNSKLIDEVAAVNDSLAGLPAHLKRRTMLAWISNKLRTMQ